MVMAYSREDLYDAVEHLRQDIKGIKIHDYSLDKFRKLADRWGLPVLGRVYAPS